MDNTIVDDQHETSHAKGQQSSDHHAAKDNRADPVELQARHYDIVPQNSGGDLIFECTDKTSFLVSSAVLRLTSTYFKTLLDGDFREGQVSRSAAYPQRIRLSGEEDSYALHRLLCILHHQRDPDAAEDLTNSPRINPGIRLQPPRAEREISWWSLATMDALSHWTGRLGPCLTISRRRAYGTR